MENLDLIVMSVIVTAVFGVFSISFLKGIGPKDGIKKQVDVTDN